MTRVNARAFARAAGRGLGSRPRVPRAPLGLLLLAGWSLVWGPAPAAAQMHTTRAGVPEWTVDPGFREDVFTFARVQYSSGYGGFGRRWGGSDRWAIDYPDAELNLAFRLQQMTSMKVNPDAVVVQLAVDDLSRYPFLYIVEPGRLRFQDDEIQPLRGYLLRGGFLMFDDFWGEADWANVEQEIRRVFPDRPIVDLPLEHPIFHCVFDLKKKPQVPGIQASWKGHPEMSYETPDSKTVHYRAIFDDQGRMMVIICQNTDLGDGWEREGEDEWYFRTFSEPMAYPMAINIIFWAMTH